MVPAPPEPVVAPDLHDVEADGGQSLRQAVEEARQVARGRVVFATQAPLLRGQLLATLPTWPFGKDTDHLVVAYAVRPAAVADDVVVEVGNDVPALRLGIVGQDLAAEQPLLLSRQRRIDDRPGKLVLRQHPRRFEYRSRSRPIVVRTGRIRCRVHHVRDAAVDVAGDDYHVVRPLGPALDRHRVADLRGSRHASASNRVAGLKCRQATLLQLRLGPPHRRPDAALRVGLRRKRMPSPEADELLYVGA